MVHPKLLCVSSDSTDSTTSVAPRRHGQSQSGYQKAAPAGPSLTERSRPASVLTAGEDQRAGVRVHGEVVQLKPAFRVDGEPVGEPSVTRVVSQEQASKGLRQGQRPSHHHRAGAGAGAAPRNSVLARALSIQYNHLAFLGRVTLFYF